MNTRDCGVCDLEIGSEVAYRKLVNHRRICSVLFREIKPFFSVAESCATEAVQRVAECWCLA